MQSNVDIMKGLNLNSSLSDVDVLISDSEYKERLVALISSILQNKFPGNTTKQKIRIHKDRLNFSCPYCADSVKSDYKKRGNVILKGKFSGYYKCFNCNEFHRVDRFFSDFKVTLDLNVVNYISKDTSDFANKPNAKYDISLFLDEKAIDKYSIDRKDFLKYFGLKEAKETPIWSWLINRMQYDAQKFLYDERQNNVIILNLTSSGKILGVQKRTFKGQNKYLTYKLSKLYELMKKDPKEIPDEIDAVSQLFNICLIDYSKPITLFEGPFDAFLFNKGRNSIANAGANKSFPFDLNIRYFYDKDKTGTDKAIEKINNNEYVFLWGKFLRDVNAPQRSKWDLNDLIVWSKKNNVSLPSFELYFSNDALDVIDL